MRKRDDSKKREWRMRRDIHEIKEKKMRRRGTIDDKGKERIERLEQG